MSEPLYSGAFPEDVDLRLENRDQTPLPEDALLRYQYINKGKDPTANYRWLLYEDGRFFIARHSGVEGDRWQPVDTDYPDKPSAVVTADDLAGVKDILDKDAFAEEAPYQIGAEAKGGDFVVITARLDGSVHEVVYDTFVALTPVLSLLRTFERRYGREQKSKRSFIKKFRRKKS